MTYRAREYYGDESVVRTYDADRFSSRRGRFVDRREKALFLAAIRAVPIAPGALIADVPTGTGRLAIRLAEAGFHVIGIDLSGAMLDVAVARWKVLPETIRPRALEGEAEHLPLEDASCDLVVSLRLFGHLPPPVRIDVLLELRRVAREAIIVTYYHRHSLQSVLRGRRGRTAAWHPVSLAQIDDEFAAAGLRRTDRRFMVPLVSETVVVTARPR